MRPYAKMCIQSINTANTTMLYLIESLYLTIAQFITVRNIVRLIVCAPIGLMTYSISSAAIAIISAL